MSSPTAESQINQRVKAILRRDLKLGSDAEIADDMPLVGGEFDIDSLDVVLLVSSIEKEFGIKLPKQAASTEVFASVGSMVEFLEGQAEAEAGSGAGEAQARASSQSDSAPKSQPLAQTLAGLPHAEPFRFVSELTAVESGVSAEGIWRVSGDEAFFAGHFPGQPIVPGVLISEALAQVSGLIAADPTRVLAQVEVRFKQPVAPPAEIQLSSQLDRSMPPLNHFHVQASVNGEVVAEGALTLAAGDAQT